MMLKSGVKLTDLVPQMVLAAIVVQEIYSADGVPCVITSGNDSTHSPESLHYKGCALDFRTHNYTGDKLSLRNEVKTALGDNYDVVIEDLGAPNEHLHVEYDPKG